MKNKMSLATVMLFSFVLVACGGGGGSGSTGGQANDAVPMPVRINQAPSEYDEDYIDVASVLPSEVNLSSTNAKYIETSNLYGELRVTKNPNANVNKGIPAFDYNFRTVGAIAKEHRPKVEKLDATFVGKMYALLGDDKNEISQRNVVFMLKDAKISGHSIKRSANDVQVKFKTGNIIERTGNNHNPQGVGFEGNIEITNVKGKVQPEEGNYFGYFYGNGSDIKGLAGKFNGYQDDHQGAFFADKKEKAAK